MPIIHVLLSSSTFTVIVSERQSPKSAIVSVDQRPVLRQRSSTG